MTTPEPAANKGQQPSDNIAADKNVDQTLTEKEKKIVETAMDEYDCESFKVDSVSSFNIPDTPQRFRLINVTEKLMSNPPKLVILTRRMYDVHIDEYLPTKTVREVRISLFNSIDQKNLTGKDNGDVTNETKNTTDPFLKFRNGKNTASSKSFEEIKVMTSKFDMSSLDDMKKIAWETFSTGRETKNEELLKKAMDMFQKLVFATDGKDGKQLYFLGRCQEEISKLTGDSSVMNKANANFKKAAEVLTKTPDPTQAVSATDATDKAETTTSAANSAGFSSWPIASPVVNSKFGMRNGKPHRGIDLRARSPLPLKAIADGKVVQVTTQSGYGKVLAIEHNINGKKYYSFYAHLSNNSIAVGTAVKAGQDIPTVRTGNTGVGTGPHLHFEIRVGENNKLKAQDPLKFLGTFDYKKK